jgi:hypothetical protein
MLAKQGSERRVKSFNFTRVNGRMRSSFLMLTWRAIELYCLIQLTNVVYRSQFRNGRTAFESRYGTSYTLTNQLFVWWFFGKAMNITSAKLNIGYLAATNFALIK